jgi:hypothetical protein
MPFRGDTSATSAMKRATSSAAIGWNRPGADHDPLGPQVSDTAKEFEELVRASLAPRQAREPIRCNAGSLR